MSMGGTRLHVKEMTIYTTEATKTRPFKLFLVRWNLKLQAGFFLRNRILAYRQRACTISPRIPSPD